MRSPRLAALTPATVALSALLAIGAGLTFAAPARADDEVVLRIKDHMFIPPIVEVPAGAKVTLVVKNEDPTPEEFESHPLKIEKVVKGGKEIKVSVGPLKPGEYKFFGEFNEDTAKGVLVAK